MHGPRRALAALALCCLTSVAWAHDTWLQVAAQQPGSGLLGLEMGSGARYPASEAAVAGWRLVRAGCADEAGTGHALAPRQERDLVLVLRARTGSAHALGCWTELRPVDVVLAPGLVEAYLREIRAPQAVKDAWAARQKAGVGWKEIEHRSLRIETAVPGASPAASWAALRQPRGAPLELVPVGDVRLRAGVAAEFQALANGRPVAGLAVEAVSRRHPIGVWKETDAHGRIQLALPESGEWLLRAAVLAIPPTPQDAWRSNFATLVVQVQ